MTQLEEYQDVLIADDDTDDFEVIAEAIRELELKVTVSRAENGDILLKLIDERVPDLLFLDIYMPCRDGKSCILEIRRQSKFDNLSIIVYTSHREENLVDFCFRGGANLFVYKPDTYSDLLELLRRIFSFNWKNNQYYPKRSDFVMNP